MDPLEQPTGAGGDAEEIKSEDAEVLEEEPRNLLISLLSEIKIGMDLSRVPLPTFILEPRSLLEKFCDFMIHCDQLSGVAKLDDPVERLYQITRWYLTGFVYKPKGVKKPYNPILGEIFRSKWQYSGTTAHLIAEQISHHPPVSCIYISNRKDGYAMTGIIGPRSKLMRASLAVLVEGSITLHLLERNEEYTFNFPNIFARGILFGTLLTEIAGNTTISCKQTNLRADMDFKAKPFFGGEYNTVSGKIKRKDEVLYSFSGKWDNRIDITNTKKKTTEVFWDCKTAKKTPRIIRPISTQEANESQRLWTHVSQAIIKKDQKEATNEKIKLENEQRNGVKDRKEKGVEWEPKYFKKIGDKWVYKYANEWTQRLKSNHLFPIYINNSNNNNNI
ncbi:oxysterol binding family protein [Heterostelium album PN500]|uniref:Oxysterol binding family protein n=1 Tax=Heterostelium pallidum (strain ATCC 26659 / Pp 5 / PN500) TaxID=670386 RepID=D3BFF7_HETP5|nr:oxysterol binding family protein [Heterostelium album PN500]EFA79871.1 oxysterol binding family protein [Heterostelium album PN500]|eukprot:XP_020431992.1 oxysterol binding family protein [Heterostelium album PN500]